MALRDGSCPGLQTGLVASARCDESGVGSVPRRHRNRCPRRWCCQHGGVCRQPDAGRGSVCFPGEEVSSPSVGVFKGGAHILTFLLGWRARPGHVVSILATNPSSLLSRGGLGHPHHGPRPPARVPGGPPRGGGPGSSSASGGGPGGRRGPGGRPGAAAGEAGVRGASGEEDGPGGGRAAAPHAACAAAELPGHDGPAAHEHPHQQPRYRPGVAVRASEPCFVESARKPTGRRNRQPRRVKPVNSRPGPSRGGSARTRADSVFHAPGSENTSRVWRTRWLSERIWGVTLLPAYNHKSSNLRQMCSRLANTVRVRLLWQTQPTAS